MTNNTPIFNAEQIINKYYIKSPEELNLEEIANAEYLIVEETDTEDYQGRINFIDDYGLISINRNIPEPGVRRFTLAHEIGHFFNERDIKSNQLHSCRLADIHSFKTKKQLENEANQFAAELLMFKPWFGEFIRRRKINMELVRDIANHFGVSLTAAAIRYANIGKYPAAVILSKNGEVKWSCINEYFPFKWIPNGYRVREDSAAFDYFAGKEVQTCEDLMPAYVWFTEDFKIDKSTYLYEQNLVMHKYASVLTLLWESDR